jgi:NTE family protein
MAGPHELSALSPVSDVAAERRTKLEEGVALCLSGGGYRAMLFHTGVLWRLNELGYLTKLDRVSSVSGGSITAATLALAWPRLASDGGDAAVAFRELVVTPLRNLSRVTIDAASIAAGILWPRKTIGDKVADAYRKHLFGDATLQDLPDRPRFVINATNVQTGSLWRFSKPYMADYRIGVYHEPRVDLAVAVAASSAFPPMLSPVRISVDPDRFAPEGRGELYEAPYTTDVVLSDGGVYDNLGLETTWKRYRTVLVSDGGGQMSPEPKPSADWARHSVRVSGVVDNQVRSLRKRQVIAGFERGDRAGAYWGIRSAINGFAPPGGGLPCPPKPTMDLARTKTRLRHMPNELQERLINWGYAICDAAMRTHVIAGDVAPAPRFPYPNRGVG